MLIPELRLHSAGTQSVKSAFGYFCLFIHFSVKNVSLIKKIRQFTCKIQPIFLILMTRGDGFIRNGIT